MNCCPDCRASENMIPELKVALENISPPGRACWADNCPCHSPAKDQRESVSGEEWKVELREFFDKFLKPKKQTMKNLERELLVDFVRAERQKEYERGFNDASVKGYDKGYERGREEEDRRWNKYHEEEIELVSKQVRNDTLDEVEKIVKELKAEIAMLPHFPGGAIERKKLFQLGILDRLRDRLKANRDI